MSPPKRRIRLKLELQADSVGDAIVALNDIECMLADTDEAGSEACIRTSGGTRDGWHLEMSCDPEQTAERFAEQLATWHRSRRADR